MIYTVSSIILCIYSSIKELKIIEITIGSLLYLNEDISTIDYIYQEVETTLSYYSQK